MARANATNLKSFLTPHVDMNIELNLTRFMPTPLKFLGRADEKKVMRQELIKAESSADRQASRAEQQKKML